MSTEHKQAHLIIKGRVQGVCFRAFAREEAQRLELVGWVKNLPDESVEMVAEGPREALDRLIKWAHKGPPAARVETVVVEWDEATGEFKTFGMKY